MTDAQGLAVIPWPPYCPDSYIECEGDGGGVWVQGDLPELEAPDGTQVPSIFNWITRECACTLRVARTQRAPVAGSLRASGRLLNVGPPAPSAAPAALCRQRQPAGRDRQPRLRVRQCIWLFRSGHRLPGVQVGAHAGCEAGWRHGQSGSSLC